MSTEIQSEPDTYDGVLTPETTADQTAVFVRLEKNLRDDAALARRRKLLRRVFGKTNKSPFGWALGVASEKNSPQKLIQRAHRQFWNAKSVAKGTAKKLQQHCAMLASAEDLLGSIAMLVYDCDMTVQVPEVLQPDDPSLQFQLQNVELQIWNGLNTGADAELELVDALEELTQQMFDGDGWPEAGFFHEFGLLAASWLRCAKLFDHLGIALDAGTESRFDWLTRQLIRSTRYDGSLFFDEQNAGINCRSFAKSLADYSLDRSVKKLLLCRSGDAAKSKSKSIRNLPAPSSVSEWAQTSVLRSAWAPGSPAVASLFGQSKIELELANKFTVIAGNCTPTVWIDGELQQPCSEICVTCELEFDDVDILELELDYGQWKLQRQLVMLRDGLVLITDNVLGEQPARIEYRCEFPLATATQAVEEGSTTEMYIKKGASYCLVLPLALPEWQAQRTEDRFLAQDGRLVLTQSIDGQCLAAPLLFDLKPKRSVKPRTWRQLTVAENLEIVPNDVAVAYRAQIGKQQWIFYRSLARNGNRTFLGENVVNQFCVGKIDRNGYVHLLAEVE